MNELSFHNHENGLKVAKMLLDESYVVMLSYEEQLLIVDYEWTPNYADRNWVTFMSRDDYEEKVDELVRAVREEFEEDSKL